MITPTELQSNRVKNRTAARIMGNPHPFLKWAGGKRQLIPQIEPYLPKEVLEYFEPFVGGGALFFYLLPNTATLMDINPELVNVYQVIKSNVMELIELLKHHRNEESYFYELRCQDRRAEFETWSDVEKASRTLYLNRCCYNGLYRVNSHGHFNAPFGKYKNPNFCNEENLLAVHDALQNVNIFCSSFEKVLESASKKSFLYLDPPYHPVTNTSNFTGYTKNGFGIEEQVNLKKTMDQLSAIGSKVMISNSYCDFILNLYQNYRIEIVQATRAINSHASKRGPIKEILIMNY